MNKYLKTDPWCIIEEEFNAERQEASESIYSIGNGKMGHRANFEEHYSGESLQGNYFAGVFYPDKTRVGWWKNGYPEYFGKMINGTNWIGIDVWFENEQLDLAKCKVSQFKRVLNMKEGLLSRSFYAEMPSGKMVQVSAKRFISIANTRMAAISYSITPINFAGKAVIKPFLDADVQNKDSNYNEKFWDEVSKGEAEGIATLQVKTKKLDFHVCSAMKTNFFVSGKKLPVSATVEQKEKYIAQCFDIPVKQNETLTIVKYIANTTSLDVDIKSMAAELKKVVVEMEQAGFDKLFEAHRLAWEKKWEKSDIVIEGDDEAQQGIRFNIFQLNQTYTGEDERLNIGPKGFTGEKYGGGTYWDTEAFCYPFYLNTSNSKVARSLLVYRYKQLQKAIENAQKLGFTGGAALYPMVTINGEECHNEWEITFEEIHRNGAIAYAIYNYIIHTNDYAYIAEYGLEVLIALSRFWAQRVNFSNDKKQYVILGVTGPNEYENNVNNNWYTNTLAQWTLKFTMENIKMVAKDYPQQYEALVKSINFNEANETKLWDDIAQNMYLPAIAGTNIRLQQDGFLDKELRPAESIPKEQRPINQHWSWDRILRSCFIKQGDVIQGMYFFVNDFSVETIRDNFNYYEPMTVHESSLSASIYSVIASHIGKIDKAYELYVRTSRLDLDDYYNREVDEGLHITSMAGTWLAIVEGFARKRIINNTLSFEPLIPEKWNKYSFKIQFRNHLLEIIVSQHDVLIHNHYPEPISIMLYGSPFTISANSKLHYQKK